MQRNSLHFQKIAHKKIEMIKMMIIISELSLKLKKFFGFTLIIIVERTEDRNSDTINFIFLPYQLSRETMIQVERSKQQK